MSNSVEYKKGYSLSQVSRELDIHRKTVYSWVERGLISATKLSTGRFFVSEDELNRVKGLLSGKPYKV